MEGTSSTPQERRSRATRLPQRGGDRSRRERGAGGFGRQHRREPGDQGAGGWGVDLHADRVPTPTRSPRAGRWYTRECPGCWSYPSVRTPCPSAHARAAGHGGAHHQGARDGEDRTVASFDGKAEATQEGESLVVSGGDSRCPPSVRAERPGTGSELSKIRSSGTSGGVFRNRTSVTETRDEDENATVRRGKRGAFPPSRLLPNAPPLALEASASTSRRHCNARNRPSMVLTASRRFHLRLLPGCVFARAAPVA